MKKYVVSSLVLILIVGLAITLSAQDKTVVEVWMHSGKPHERNAMDATFKRFNAAHDSIKAEINYITEVSYEEKVKTAAIAGKLPDVLDVDGPYVTSWSWRGFFRPIDKYISDEELSDFLDSIIEQGTWGGKLYALGQFESGLGLYYRKSILEEAGIKPPRKLAKAWSWDELMNACKKVMNTGKVDTCIDLKWEYKGEWKTYGFSPLVWSNGGALISPDGLKADGYLNGPPTVRALEALQAAVQKGYANPQGPKAQFLNEKAAFVLVGHWMYAPYKEKFGDDFGLTFYPGLRKTVTGSGSYTWGISAQSEHPKAAAEVLKWIVKPESILIMTKGVDFEGNRISAGVAAPPARKSVYKHYPEYTEYPLRVFTTQLKEGVAKARPVTPAYFTLSDEFRKAINDIVLGADVQKALDKAAKNVDTVIWEHDYYGLK